VRHFSEFMDCWRRVLNDAVSEQFDCATARRILAEALCLPQSALSAGTQLSSLKIDGLILETIARHAEEISGRECVSRHRRSHRRKLKGLDFVIERVSKKPAVARHMSVTGG
jgi:hypothetical protein